MKENRKKLKVNTVHSFPKPMTKEAIENSKTVLDELDSIEEMRVKIIDKKNALETYIYAKNDWFESGEAAKVRKKALNINFIFIHLLHFQLPILLIITILLTPSYNSF